MHLNAFVGSFFLFLLLSFAFFFHFNVDLVVFLGDLFVLLDSRFVSLVLFIVSGDLLLVLVLIVDGLTFSLIFGIDPLSLMLHLEFLFTVLFSRGDHFLNVERSFNFYDRLLNFVVVFFVVWLLQVLLSSFAGFHHLLSRLVGVLLAIDFLHVDVGDVLFVAFFTSNFSLFGHVLHLVLKLLLTEKLLFFAFLLCSFAGRFASRSSFRGS